LKTKAGTFQRKYAFIFCVTIGTKMTTSRWQQIQKQIRLLL